jgi:hypothetical protein
MVNETQKAASYEGWAILELMGHRRLAGYLSEQAIGGAAFIRIDVPGDGDAPVASQFYSGAAVYCITPTTEAIARAVAKRCDPAPVQRWELAPALPAAPPVYDPDDNDALNDAEPDFDDIDDWIPLT